MVYATLSEIHRAEQPALSGFEVPRFDLVTTTLDAGLVTRSSTASRLLGDLAICLHGVSKDDILVQRCVSSVVQSTARPTCWWQAKGKMVIQRRTGHIQRLMA
jgi:hypothetical protein